MYNKNTLLQRFILFSFLSVTHTLIFAQTGSVSGRIVSNKGEALIGAIAKIKGTTIGAASDFDGNFSIKEVPVGEQTIMVTYIGYSPKQVSIEVKQGENTLPDVKMKEDAMLLNEVVAIGYGTQIKREMSSSVAEVKADEIKDKPVYSFTSALQGKASGVQITTDNGLAGAATTVRIRGTKTLSSVADPLYIVDGVPIVTFDISNSSNVAGYNTSPLSTINPNDIESIDILKDAAATAIYGARGANGVVIITTKQGKSGKTKIDASFNSGISMPTHKIQLLNSQQYLQLHHEAWENDSLANPATYKGQKETLPNLVNKDSAANTNWLDQMFRVGYFNEGNVAVSGGDAKTNFYTGFGIRDEKGFVIGNSFQRISFRANLNHVANKIFSFGVNTSITRTDNRYVPSGGAGGLGNAQSTMLPIYPVKNADGSYYLGGANPVAQVNLNNFEAVSFHTIDNAWFAVNLIKGLTFRNEFGMDINNQVETFYSPKEITGDSAVATDRRNLFITWNYNSTLSYKKEINKDNALEVLVGFNPTETTQKYTYIQKKGFPLNNLYEPNEAFTILSATAGTGRQYAFLSYFARVNYKLMNKHVFQLSFRADGSSRFSPENRYGYFPAFSYGYIMSEEKFFQRQKALTFFKIRASVGQSGNAEFTDDFPYITSYGTTSYQGNSGITPNTTSVNNLTWETTTKTDVGIDFGFLNGRVSGMFDFYQDNTRNVLIQSAPLAPSSGFSAVTKNLGKIRNRGIEMQLTSNNLAPNSPVKWKTVMNLALNRNKVTDLGGVAEVSGTNYGDNRAIVGQPVGIFYIAQYAGIDPKTGQQLIYDTLGNKVVATAASTLNNRKPVGRPYPLFYGGLTNTFSYKGFDLEIHLTYNVGNSIYDDHGKRSIGNIGYGWNQDIQTLNRWQKPGDITDVQKLSLTQNYDLNTSRYLYNGSYLRLRNVTLAYNLPESALRRMKMRQFRVFISGQNLATLTKYKGWDPEINRDNSGAITQGVSYLSPPQARILSAGFNIGL